MTVEEIKKELYKQNPKAKISFITEGTIYYNAVIKKDPNDDEATNNSVYLIFAIPMEDTKGTRFNSEEPAKLLIKWLHI